MISILHKLLFQLDPEQAHYAALKSLQFANNTGLSRLYQKIPSSPREVMGITFPNSVGLAAGFDKNADYVDALAALGFGFIEIGTVTPKPQDGNPRPRLFRLTPQEAIINRMGFNNKGVEYVAKRLEQTKYRGILGINIGKNKDTPIEKSADDYLIGFRALWKFASYITINISSPNTPGLRDLQKSDLLASLLISVKQERDRIHQLENKYIPLVVKISPDLNEDELQQTADVLLQQKIDGVIATNTTISRDGVEDSSYASEIGGLSGKPLFFRSTNILRQLHSILKDNIPIIASGGVMDADSAKEKFSSGAKLVQIYSGFIYAGPGLIKKIAAL